MATASLIASATFLGLLTLIAVWHARRIETGVDFALAGRRLPMGVVAGTLVATWIGTGSIFGNAEFAYEHGLLGFVLPFSGGVGVLCLAALAGRVRSLPADSIPQILKLRFGRGAQVLAAVALVGSYLIIVSYQYRAGAAVLGHLVPGLDSRVPGVVAFGLFVILYTALAGMVSVAWTDVVNGTLMAIGLLATLACLMAQYATGDAAELPEVPELSLPIEPISGIGWIGIVLPAFLLVLGDANLYQRFMSARSPRAATQAAIGMFCGILILEWTIIGIAWLGRQLLASEPENHAYAVITVAFELVPAWLGVLLVMSITAVIVTTADSYLLGSATSVSADLAGGLSTPGRQRFVVVVLGLIAIGLAFTSDRFFSVALYAYTLYGATLTPAVIAALLFEKTPSRAVVGGMAAGLTTAVLWKAAATWAWLPDSAAQIEPVLAAIGMNLLVMGLIACRPEPADTP